MFYDAHMDRFLASVTVLFLIGFWTWIAHQYPLPGGSTLVENDTLSFWATISENHPVDSFTPIPEGDPGSIPRLQADCEPKNTTELQTQRTRLEAVKGNFTHAWDAYRKLAWLEDEVRPLSGDMRNYFPGWGLTLIDSLDMLWLLDLKEDFEEAVEAVATIDFGVPSRHFGEIDILKVTVHYLGGLISAYEISEMEYSILLEKATQLGHLLYHAFDTPNRMPVTRWNPRHILSGQKQFASETTILAELAGLPLEFTRLSQLTGDPRWFDATQRVTDFLWEQRTATFIPGLWPKIIDARHLDDVGHVGFSVSHGASNAYEVLPKMHLLLGGGSSQYQDMISSFPPALKKNMLFRPMFNLPPQNLFLSPYASVQMRAPGFDEIETPEPTTEHLGCYLGATMALTGKIFSDAETDPSAKGIDRFDDMTVARALTKTCARLHKTSYHGIMPEALTLAACPDVLNCPWNETAWLRPIECCFSRMLEFERYCARASRLPPGVTSIPDNSYNLRPETIESLFVLYRTTGEKRWQEMAWSIFEKVINATTAKYGHARLANCVGQMDREEEWGWDLARDRDLEMEREWQEVVKGQIEIGAIIVGYDGNATEMEEGEDAPENEALVRLLDGEDVALGSTQADSVDVDVSDSQKALPKDPKQSDDEKNAAASNDTKHQRREIDPETGWNHKIAKRLSPGLMPSEVPEELRSKIRWQVVQKDKMESYWLAKTLKYFYLIFADEDVMSLDEWVFSNGGHGFRWREVDEVPE
ncbi:MAG: hypothetical protein Q9159_000166 [Coniocarpon cinnabarinum]